MRIYDNGGKTWDRYTVFETNPQIDHTDSEGNDYYECLGLSDNCDTPSGFSQWSSGQQGSHLGKRVQLLDLPTNVQNHILSRVSI